MFAKTSCYQQVTRFRVRVSCLLNANEHEGITQAAEPIEESSNCRSPIFFPFGSKQFSLFSKRLFTSSYFYLWNKGLVTALATPPLPKNLLEVLRQIVSTRKQSLNFPMVFSKNVQFVLNVCTTILSCQKFFRSTF